MLKPANNTKFKFPSDTYLTLQSFMCNNDVTEETITEEMLEWYSKNVCDVNNYNNPKSYYRGCKPLSKYVNEMLSTSTVRLLIKVLNRELDTSSGCISIEGEITHNYDGHLLRVPIKAWNYEDFLNICDKMMWIPTVVQTPQGTFEKYSETASKYTISDYLYIGVEPLKGVNCDSYVKECGSILFHVCQKSSLKKILTKGLRMKGEGSEYRLMKNKVFVICGKTRNQLILNIKEVSETINLYNGKTFDKNFALIKINARNYNISYFKDTAYGIGTEGILFTYGYFPPSMLEDCTDEFFFEII